MLDNQFPTMPDMATEWTEAQEAERLRARFDAPSAPKQAAFARATEFPGGANMLNQIIQARRPMTLEMATCVAKGFGVSLAEISPRWDRIVRAALELGGGPQYSELERDALYIASEFNRIADQTRRASLFHELVMLISEAIPGGQRPAPAQATTGQPIQAQAEAHRNTRG